jgi:hypothetical protein
MERMRQGIIELGNCLVKVMAKRDKKWASYDDERLLRFSDAGTPLPVIATALGRTRPAVEGRLATLKKQTVEPPSDSNAGEPE